MARSPTLTAALAEFKLTTCGDSSCMYGPAGGMMTNGGCRCLARSTTPGDLRHASHVARRLAHVARKLAAQVDQARAEIERLRLLVCRLTSGQAIESDHLCPHDDKAVAAMADRDAALAKLAEAKRLGLEACSFAADAADAITQSGIDDDDESRAARRAADRIRTALEAL